MSVRHFPGSSSSNLRAMGAPAPNAMTNKQTIELLLKEIKLKFDDRDQLELALESLMLFIEFCCQKSINNTNLLLLKIKLSFSMGQQQWAQMQLSSILAKLSIAQIKELAFIIQESSSRKLRLSVGQHLFAISDSQSNRQQILRYLRGVSILSKSVYQKGPNKNVQELLLMFNLLELKGYVSVLRRDFLAQSNYFQAQRKSLTCLNSLRQIK